jgi:hypothetical protein
MLDWLRKHLDTPDFFTPDETTEVQLVVVYNINKGTGFNSLLCSAKVRTEFFGNPDSQLTSTANTAAQILCDARNIEYVYRMIVGNMLHVPESLRKNPH